MSSIDQDTLILTASNLQKHTITSHETPRTKIMRYLDHQFPEQGEEDSQVLKNGSSSSSLIQNPSPWDPTLDFMPRQPGASPILGQKPPKRTPPPQQATRDTFKVFASEDSDILIPNRNKDNLPTSTTGKRARDDDSETNYSWEGTPEPPKHELKENVYERRPRRKMLQDPVTGEIHTNSKRSRQSRQAKRDKEIATGMKAGIAKQDKYLDLRPLNKFHSKLLDSASRLSLGESSGRAWIKGNDLKFPKLTGLERRDVVGVTERGKRKGVKNGSELSRSGKRRKIGEPDVEAGMVDEHQISSYFEMAKDVEERVHERPVCEAISEKEKIVVEKGNVENTEIASPSDVKLVGEQESKDRTVEEVDVLKKDPALQVDSNSSAPVAQQEDLVAESPSQDEQWVQDMLTDPSPTPDDPSPLPAATSVELNYDQQSPPLSSFPKSTARLIRYAETLLPGNHTTYDPNLRPQRVLFSMDQTETPTVWNNSYDPFGLSPYPGMENIPDMEAEIPDERIVECFMYPIVDDDKIRYITGPAFDPKRSQPWQYGKEAQDETLYDCPTYPIPGSDPEMMGFRGGKHGEIDLGERIPLIRTGPNFRNRPTTRYTPNDPRRLTSQVQNIQKSPISRGRRRTRGPRPRTRQTRQARRFTSEIHELNMLQDTEIDNIHETFAELERQMLAEEDRGVRDDWDDLMWTISEDEEQPEVAEEHDYTELGPGVEGYAGSGTRICLSGGRDTKNSCTISQEEKEHWKKLNRRL